MGQVPALKGSFPNYWGHDSGGARAVETAPGGPAATKPACADFPESDASLTQHPVGAASLQPAQAGFVAERSEALQARF